LSTASTSLIEKFFDRTWRHSQQKCRLIRYTIIYSIAVLEDKQSYLMCPHMEY